MGKFSQFKISLKTLSEGVHSFEYHLDKDFFVNMENTDIHDADLKVSLTVDHRRDVYDMNFHIEGTVTVLCDRCLDTLELPIDTDYHILVKFGEDYNDESDDLLIIPDSDPTLNVSYLIYDTVIVAIPTRHVHPLGKCNRAMSRKFKSHRAVSSDSDDFDDELIEEVEEGDFDSPDIVPESTDPRWDALKGLAD